MDIDGEDLSMSLYRWKKTEIITSATALKLADLVFRRVFGDAVTDGQLPLGMQDLGDRWQVEGSTNVPSSVELVDPVGGRVEIVIMKVECRIVKLVRNMIMAEDGWRGLPFPPELRPDRDK